MSIKLLHPCGIRTVHDKLNSPVIKIGELEVPIDINKLVLRADTKMSLLGVNSSM
jgi:hypothetical protein